ncbi:hypothetical protein [Chondromyces apiculatus]|uniref:Uncharacterized protein n=1 Tax=Chondromyces apiculatus DSM 436 TaxID=1192034 RepID=A0A017TFD2_9BACT|nr:hypothetical protein [Chondromyces apiculatus]EYF07607.1 Hypothetical protein CAP_8108 [Chondromyces apiculatus DSM 436]
MGLFEITIAAAVLVIVAFQLYLTVRVFRSSMYEQKQKVWQAQLIWLVPIIGAGLVFSILQEDDRAEKEARRAERDASQHLKG